MNASSESNGTTVSRTASEDLRQRLRISVALDAVMLLSLGWFLYCTSLGTMVFDIEQFWASARSLLAFACFFAVAVCAGEKVNRLGKGTKADFDDVYSISIMSSAAATAAVHWLKLDWKIALAVAGAFVVALPLYRVIFPLAAVKAADESSQPSSTQFTPRRGCDCPECIAHFHRRNSAIRSATLYYAAHLPMIGRVWSPKEFFANLAEKSGDDSDVDDVLRACDRMHRRIVRLSEKEKLRSHFGESPSADPTLIPAFIEEAVAVCMHDGHDSDAVRDFAAQLEDIFQSNGENLGEPKSEWRTSRNGASAKNR